MKNAITTLLLNNNLNYLLGACVIANSLKQHNPNRTFDLTIMVAFKDKPLLKLLKKEFDHVFVVPEIVYKVSTKRWKRFDKNYEGWLAKCFTKINMYLLVQYEKVLFLDADMVCIGSIEDVFKLQTPAGCITTQDKKLIKTGIKLDKNFIFQSMKNAYGISGACILIHPSKKMFNWMIHRLETFTKHNKTDYTEGKYNAGPDEQLVTMSEIDKWLNISREYNSQPWLIEHYEKQGGKVKIIHYFQTKPWSVNFEAQFGDQDYYIWKDFIYWFDAFKKCSKGVRDRLPKIDYKRFTLTE